MMMFASERNGKDEAPSLVQHSSMDERLLSASMHEVQQMLGPAILSSQRASSGKDPRAVARDDYGSAPEDESDVVESGGEKPATGPLVDADWRPLLLKQQTSEETTTTVQLRSPNEAEGPGLRASTATDADGQLPQSRYGAASSGDSVTADTGASAADATSEQVGPDMLNETIPPRKRKRGLYANGDALEAGGAYEVGGNAGGAISATATTAEAHASHAPQNVALVRELSVEAVAERGGRQGVESRGVSRRNTRETTGSCGSYSELNLTMESALSALYDDSLPPLTTTAEHFGPSSVGPAPNSAHDPKYYAPPQRCTQSGSRSHVRSSASSCVRRSCAPCRSVCRPRSVHATMLRASCNAFDCGLRATTTPSAAARLALTTRAARRRVCHRPRPSAGTTRLPSARATLPTIPCATRAIVAS